MNSTAIVNPTYIEDPSRDKKSRPFLFLPLYKLDIGENGDRDKTEEYTERTPFCVKWTNTNINLTIRNSGLVASDLITLEYQFVFCVDDTHGITDGFIRDHAGEQTAPTLDKLKYVSFVPARKSITMEIPYSSPSNLANLYFRARVSTLWEKKVDRSAWNFKDDPAVTEFTKHYNN